MLVDPNASKTGKAVIGFHVSAPGDGRTPLWATGPQEAPSLQVPATFVLNSTLFPANMRPLDLAGQDPRQADLTA
jgi:hypothetical protein